MGPPKAGGSRKAGQPKGKVFIDGRGHIEDRRIPNGGPIEGRGPSRTGGLLKPGAHWRQGPIEGRGPTEITGPIEDRRSIESRGPPRAGGLSKARGPSKAGGPSMAGGPSKTRGPSKAGGTPKTGGLSKALKAYRSHLTKMLLIFLNILLSYRE